MDRQYNFHQEKAHNQALASEVNEFWAQRGKDARARAIRLIVGKGRKSRKYWTVVSSVEISWAG